MFPFTNTRSPRVCALILVKSHRVGQNFSGSSTEKRCRAR